jgi:glycosyltransferase involved in cell wall biosynthesis
VIVNILFLRKHKASVFHITGDIHYAALAFPSDKVILTVHDCIFLQHPSPVKRWLLKKLWLDWPVRHSSRVTTISEATKADIVRSSGCHPDKVVVIPDPLDESFTHHPRVYNQDCPVIFQVGTWPNKNLERVIEALRGFRCHLRVIGKLSEQQASLLREAGIDYSNGFQLPKDQLINWYQSSDIIMFATLFEGFGLPILEAQATGRPVITSNIPPMDEVAGKGACLIDPTDVSAIRDAVLRIHQDPLYREELIRQGLENVRRYDADQVAARYLSLYQQMSIF